MADYNCVAGIVQFEPTTRKASGQTVRDVLVKAFGSNGKNVKITVWPEFNHAEIKQGDLVAADGKFTQSSVNGKEYFNLSASTLVVVPSVGKAARVIENALEDEDSPF